MANTSHRADLIVGLVDNVSKPARSVAQALEETARRAKDVAKAMDGSGATDRLTASLSK